MNQYSDISLTWFGDITSISSSAQYARALLEPLIKGGAMVKLEPANFGIPQADLQPWWHTAIQTRMNAMPGMVKINHCAPNQATPNILGGPQILLTHWDTYQVPQAWVNTINSNFKRLLTSNETCLVESDGMFNIHTGCIPYPLEPDTGTDVTEIADIDEDTVVFGYTGAWDNRSNISDLIIAFCAEFSKQDNVALVIKTNAKYSEDPNQKLQIINLVREIKKQVNNPLQPPIVVVQDLLTQNAMDALIRRFNVYVSTARGSSLNITMSKCLAMGKPCIVPANGVHADYDLFSSSLVRYYNTFLEPVTQLSAEANHKDFWGRPDMRGFMDELREVYANLTMHNMEDKFKEDQKNFLTAYSPDKVADKLADQIRKSMPFKMAIR